MKTITPEVKKQVQAIYNEYKESNTNYLQRQIDVTDPSNLFSDLYLKEGALGEVTNLHYCIVENASIITSAFSALLKEDKRMGCLTDKGMDKVFDVLAHLIRFAGSQEQFSLLWSIYSDKQKLIREYDDDLEKIIGEQSA